MVTALLLFSFPWSMSRESLDTFLNQLAQWVEQIIESGRTPFRKVEINPPLVHASCTDLPHLVLWINRDSHMAGGLILLPEKEADQDLATGCALATALGLKNFVSWGRRQISIWALAEDGPSLELNIPFESTRSALRFREHLQSLLEQLKVLAVANAPTASELSPFCLANLMRLALLEITPELNEELRLHRSEKPPEQSWNGGRDAGKSKGLITILRLLAVGHADLLPQTVMADGLERALRYACSQLPAELAEQLAFLPEEPALTAGTGARLHHVWRRLQQLGCLQKTDLLATAITLLQPDIAELAPSAPRAGETSQGISLVVNPGGIPESVPPTAEVGLPVVLGWRNLLRWLRGDHQPDISSIDLERLPADLLPECIWATLDPTPPPRRQQRPQLATSLRLAWPSRRFTLGATTPGWYYDLLQLLGRAAAGARLKLKVPSSWLSGSSGVPLWELLCNDFQLITLRYETNEQLNIELLKTTGPEGTCLLQGRENVRNLPWEQLRKCPLNYLQVLLTWPECLLQLFEDGLLQLSDVEPCPVELSREEKLYWRSSWGQRLAAWCRVNADQLKKAGFRSGDSGLFCYPNLDRLRRLSNLADDPSLQDQRFDQDVADWIGPELADSSWPSPPWAGDESRSSSRPALASLLESLEEVVLVDGLPQFPIQYLYDHYRPQLARYELRGPLQESERFFGQIGLHDAQGNSLEADSDSLAACLIIASSCQQGIFELPVNPDIAADILRRYLNDLHRLRAELERESHRLLEDPAAAQRLAAKAWKRWQLPDSDSISRAEALFPAAKQVN